MDRDDAARASRGDLGCQRDRGGEGSSLRPHGGAIQTRRSIDCCSTETSKCSRSWRMNLPTFW